MNPLAAIVLDVDGTIATCPYDFDAMRSAVTQLAAQWGWQPTGEEPQGVVERIEWLAQQLGTHGGRFRSEAHRAVELIELEGARASHLLPGAKEALSELRAMGIRLALITRNCRAAAEMVLGSLQEYDALITREHAIRVKPHPAHVLQALAQLDCTPGHAAMVGDHVFDMQAGRAAGVAICIGVRSGASREADLLAAGAHAVIEDIGRLPAYVRELRERGQ